VLLIYEGILTPTQIQAGHGGRLHTICIVCKHFTQHPGLKCLFGSFRAKNDSKRPFRGRRRVNFYTVAATTPIWAIGAGAFRPSHSGGFHRPAGGDRRCRDALAAMRCGWSGWVAERLLRPGDFVADGSSNAVEGSAWNAKTHGSNSDPGKTRAQRFGTVLIQIRTVNSERCDGVNGSRNHRSSRTNRKARPARSGFDFGKGWRTFPCHRFGRHKAGLRMTSQCEAQPYA
jgi:hypothetical protein